MQSSVKLLASYAGAYATTSPTPAHEYGVYWPTTVSPAVVDQVVVLPYGTRFAVDAACAAGSGPIEPPRKPHAWKPEPTVPAPLGTVCGARSGDKGGNANVGVWTRTNAEYRWLNSELTIDRFKQLLPEAAPLEVRRFDLPNLLALNFVVVGILGEGVASSTRADPQAKALAEELRSKTIDLPISLVR